MRCVSTVHMAPEGADDAVTGRDSHSNMTGASRYPHRLLEANEWSPRQRSPVAFRIVAALSVIGFMLAVNIVLFAPPVRSQAEYLFLRAQSEIVRRLPHARYLPTPAAPAAWLSPVGLDAPAPALRPSLTAPGSSATTPRSPEAAPGPSTQVPQAASSASMSLQALATSTPMIALLPTATPTPLPPTVQLESSHHEPQGWNNCGPATLAMALHYLGFDQDQYAIAAVTKPDKNDKNVSPEEMVAYTASLGSAYALLGYGADIDVLKLLLSNGYPVIVETWFIPEPGDEMGHYRLLTGYDDEAQQFAAQDAYHGPHQVIGYAQLDRLWKVFNRVYVVVTQAERAGELHALLGDRIDPAQMHAAALGMALSEIATDPGDRYAWFNAGTNYLALDQPEEAAAAYDQARMLNLPWRILWYQFGPFEAYLQVGRYGDVVALAEANLKTARNLEESYYYRALARRALGDAAGTRTDLRVALRYNPNYVRAAEALGE
jgi:tetratricopeptide (TPR) repeat protein